MNLWLNKTKSKLYLLKKIKANLAHLFSMIKQSRIRIACTQENLPLQNDKFKFMKCLSV